MPIIAPGQPAEGVHIAAFVEKAHGAVAKHEKRPARMPAAECLRSMSVNAGAVFVYPPHDVADPNGPVPQPGHAGPQSRPFLGGCVEDALTDGQGIRSSIGHIRNPDLAVL